MAYPDRTSQVRQVCDVVDRYSAVKLFAESACRARPDFELTDEVLPDVVRICQLVEGTPLGVLLAAPWVEMLTPAEIAAEIERSLDFLERELRDVPERQHSLRAAFDHSWNLLSPRERETFAALSVFRGGFARWSPWSTSHYSIARQLPRPRAGLALLPCAGQADDSRYTSFCASTLLKSFPNRQKMRLRSATSTARTMPLPCSAGAKS
jgi:hypothetical protein